MTQVLLAGAIRLQIDRVGTMANCAFDDVVAIGEVVVGKNRILTGKLLGLVHHWRQWL